MRESKAEVLAVSYRHVKVTPGDRVFHYLTGHSCEVIQVLPRHTFKLRDIVTGQIFETRRQD